MMNHYTVINDRATRVFLVTKRDGNGEMDNHRHCGCGKIELIFFFVLALVDLILQRFLLYTIKSLVFGLLSILEKENTFSSDPLHSAKYTVKYAKYHLHHPSGVINVLHNIFKDSAVENGCLAAVTSFRQINMRDAHKLSQNIPAPGGRLQNSTSFYMMLNLCQTIFAVAFCYLPLGGYGIATVCLSVFLISK